MNDAAIEALLDLKDECTEVNWRIIHKKAADIFAEHGITWPTLNCRGMTYLDVERIEDWNKSEPVNAMFIRWYIAAQLVKEEHNERRTEGA